MAAFLSKSPPEMVCSVFEAIAVAATAAADDDNDDDDDDDVDDADDDGPICPDGAGIVLSTVQEKFIKH